MVVDKLNHTKLLEIIYDLLFNDRIIIVFNFDQFPGHKDLIEFRLQRLGFDLALGQNFVPIQVEWDLAAFEVKHGSVGVSSFFEPDEAISF